MTTKNSQKSAEELAWDFIADLFQWQYNSPMRILERLAGGNDSSVFAGQIMPGGPKEVTSE